MSFANSEVLPPLGGWFRPLIGRDSYNKKNVDTASATTLKTVGVLEKHLVLNTYLVGERLSLADLFTASLIARGFQYVSQLHVLQSSLTKFSRFSIKSFAGSTLTSLVGMSLSAISQCTLRLLGS
jgi:glutathione S-transferase